MKTCQKAQPSVEENGKRALKRIPLMQSSVMAASAVRIRNEVA